MNLTGSAKARGQERRQCARGLLDVFGAGQAPARFHGAHRRQSGQFVLLAEGRQRAIDGYRHQLRVRRTLNLCCRAHTRASSREASADFGVSA